MKNVVRIAVVVSLLLAALAAPSLLAQATSPNVEGGFQPGKAYDSSGNIDNVSLFNGNLNLTIPIGQSYRVGGNLSYGFTLHYFGNVWEHATRDDVVGTDPVTYRWSYPTRGLNAGMGWRLNFGRLVNNDAQQYTSCSGPRAWAFEGSDGAMHCLYETLHGSDSEKQTNILYSRDDTYLRFHIDTTTVELPNGTKYEFDPTTLDLQRIVDVYGNWMAIAYSFDPDHPDDAIWTITDSAGRTHYIRFMHTYVWREGDSGVFPMHQMVKQVDLQTVGGARVQYDFTYLTNPDGGWPYLEPPLMCDPSMGTIKPGYTKPDGDCSHYTYFEPVFLLSSITAHQMPSWRYAFDYLMPPNVASADFECAIHSAALPTGGQLVWTYSSWSFPPPERIINKKEPPPLWSLYLDPICVVKREAFDRGGAKLGYRTYEPDDVFGRTSDFANTVTEFGPLDEFITRTRHHFTACTGNMSCAVDPLHPTTQIGYSGEYALPVTRAIPDGVDADGLQLSTETLDASNHVLRRTFVRYEADGTLSGVPIDQTDLNRRVAASMTRSYDPATGAVIDVAKNVSSDFDGYGHYRTETTSGNFGASNDRSTFTAFNLAAPNPWPAGSKWILNTSAYQTVTATEQRPNGSPTTTTSMVTTCYDANGFLTRKRVLRAAVSDLNNPPYNTKDLLSIYTPDSNGSLLREEYLGGDSGPDAPVVGGTCAGGVTGNAYRIDHTYVNGTLQSSTYVNGSGAPLSFKTTDLIIDPSTGLATESHARANGSDNGIVTKYSYDVLGRLTDIIPQAVGTNDAEAATKYIFSFNPAKVEVYRGMAPHPEFNPLTTSTFSFDGIGRLTHEEKTMPGGVVSSRDTAYNGAGWKTSVTEWGSSYATRYTYDIFGRPLTITAPDNSVVTINYNGVKSTTRTANVHEANGDHAESTTEEVDRQGRLWKVTDALGNVTQYTYDVGSRLAHVCMFVNTNCTQQRIFNYDMAGLLTDETHPEKGTNGNGTTHYSYDARGHVINRYDGTQHGPFDVTFTYDRAERLTDVTETASQHILKHFDFGFDNASGDLRNGQLTRAVRFNWFPTRNLNVQVVEDYVYGGVGGRPSTRTTSEYECALCNSVAPGSPVRTFTQGFAYDTLGNEASLDYPKCTAGDCTALNTAPTVTNSYDQGLLTGVTFPYAGHDRLNNITYSNNGMVHTVTHANGVVDTQEPDPTGMQRPLSITAQAPACPGPTLATPTAASSTVLSGQSTQLSIAPPSGVTTPKYQWYRGTSGDTTNPLANGNTATVSSGAITLSSMFWVRVTGDNLCNSDSATVSVSVRTCDSLSITQQPFDAVISSGTAAHFTVTASSTEVHYQWYHGPSGITTEPVGTDSATFTTPALTADTSYWVRVTSNDTLCRADSVTANVHICVPPTILVQPQSKMIPWPNPMPDPLPHVTVTASIQVAGENTQIDWSEVGNSQFHSQGATLSVDFVPDDANGAAKTRTFFATVTNTRPGCEASVQSINVTLGAGSCIKILGVSGPVTVNPGDNTFPLWVNVENADSSYHYHWHHILNDGTDVDLFASNPSQWDHPQITGALNAPFDWYYCVVTKDGCGNGAAVSSAKIYVHYKDTCPLPPLTVTPLSGNLSNGPLTFTAFCDWPDVTLQWFAGATGDTTHPLVPPPTTTYTASVPGVFWVRATDGCGISHRDSPSLIVSTNNCSPVVINAQPQSVDITAGDRPTLHVDASNATTYTWFEKNGNVPLGSGRDFSPNPGPTVTTSYYAFIENSCNNTSSLPATLHVKHCASVTVNAQPASGMIRSDQTSGFDLSVNASSSGTISYQWYTGESGDTLHPVNGATLSTLHVLPEATTSYWVRMTVSACSVDSDTAVVTVCVPPHFTNANVPMTYELTAGQSVSFGIMAAGTGLHYAWHTGSASGPVEGGDYPSITVRPVDSTVYYCVVTGLCDSITAAPVTVHVCATPTIDTQPQSTTVFSGSTTTLTVHATENLNTPMTYQWYDGNGNAVGTNSPTFTTPPITDTKQYLVRITAGICWIESDTATISVCGLPQTIGSGGTYHVAAGQNVTLSLTAPGGSVITWYRGHSGDYANSTVIASGSSVVVTPSPTVNSWWASVAYGGCTSTTPDYVAIIDVPTFTTQPSSSSIVSGQTATLSAAVDIAGSTFQWYQGNSGNTTNAIGGATGASYTTPALTATTSYWVRATSPTGQTRDSNTATVSMCVAPGVTINGPSSQWIVRGSLVQMTASGTGSGITYQWYTGPAGDTSAPIANATSATYAATPQNTTSYWVQVTSTCGATTRTANSQAETVHVCTAPSITTQPADTTIFNGATATLTVVATAGTSEPLTYQWYAGASGDDSSPVANATSATFTTPALTANATYWVRVGSGIVCSTVDSTAATVNVCKYAQSVGISGNVNTAAGATTRISSTIVDAAAVFAWYQGASGDTSHPLGSPTGVNYRDVNPTVTTQYWYQLISGNCTSSSPAVTVNVCVPTITSQPAAPANPVAAGTAVTLSVTATPATGLTYQWYSGASGNTSAPLSGQTGSSVTVNPSVTTSYWVRVTSSCSLTANSNAATVAVCTATTVTGSSPSNQWITLGGSTLLSVSATGSALSYQWYTGNPGDTSHPISGATSAQYAATPTNTTTYWVLVSSVCGNANSPAMTLSVCAQPTIKTQPQNTSIYSGGTATLSVTATNTVTNPSSYQWYRGAAGDTSAPVGTNSSVFTTPALSATTSYWVRVSNGTCTVSDSTAATVTVTACPSSVTAAPDVQSQVSQSVTLTVPASVSGTSYNALQLSGSSYARVNYATALAISGPVTVEAWIKLNTAGGSAGVVERLGATSSGNGGYGLRINAGKLFFYVGYDTPDYSQVTYIAGATTISAGAWHHVAGVYDGAQVRVYLDGVLDGSKAATNGPGAGPENLVIGIYGNEAAPTGYFSGLIDEARVSSDALYANNFAPAQHLTSSATTAGLWTFDNRTLADASSNALTGTAMSTVAYTQDVPGAKQYQWYQGASGTTTTPIGSVSPSTTLTVAPAATTQYWYQLRDSNCTTNSGTTTVNVCVPVITTQPTGSSITQGQSATLTVAANTAGVTYQWYYGAAGVTTSPVTGATAASISVGPGATTSYWARATSTCGRTADSNSATVTVCNPPAVTAVTSSRWIQPSQLVTLSVTATGTAPLTYQWYYGQSGNTTSPVTDQNATQAAFNVWPQTTTSFWCRVSGPCGSAANSATVTISVCLTPSITTQPAPQTVYYNSTATLSVVASEGTSTPMTYQWYRGASGDTTNLISGATSSSYTTPVLTADADYWVRVTAGGCTPADSTAAHVTVCSLTATVGSPSSQQSAVGQTVSITSPASGTQYRFYQGNSGDTSHPVTGWQSQSFANVAPTATTTYWNQVDNSVCVANSATTTINVCVPTFTTQPASQTIPTGTAATLTSVANTAGVTYQWYVGTSGTTTSPISGATAASYTTPTLSANTSYWVRATGSCGRTTDSATATITICQPATITGQPQNAPAIFSGQSASLRVYTSGSNITYQWYKGQSGDTSTPINTATSSILTMTLTQTEMYWVKVTGQCGSVNSTSAYISVVPTIQQNPVSANTTYGGGPIPLTVASNGTYLHYTWYKNNAPISGAPDSPTYMIPSVTAAADYFCSVVSGTAPNNSATATVGTCSLMSYTGSYVWNGGGCNRSIQVGYSDYPDTYTWYRGAHGDMSTPVGTSAGLNVCISGATSYWVRAGKADPDTGVVCYVDSPTINVQ